MKRGKRGRKGEIARVTARQLYLRTGNRGIAEVGRGKFPIKGNPTFGAGRLRVRQSNNKAITIDDGRTAIIRVYRHPRKRGYVTVWPMQLHSHLTNTLTIHPLRSCFSISVSLTIDIAMCVPLTYIYASIL